MGAVVARLRAAATLVGGHEPEPSVEAPGLLARLRWKPNLVWGIAVAAVGVFAIVQISEASVFLYFNF